MSANGLFFFSTASFAPLYSNLHSRSLCVFVRVPCGQNLVHPTLRQQKVKTMSIFPPVLPAQPSGSRPTLFSVREDTTVFSGILRLRRRYHIWRILGNSPAATSSASGSCPELLPVKPIEKSIEKKVLCLLTYLFTSFLTLTPT